MSAKCFLRGVLCLGLFARGLARRGGLFEGATSCLKRSYYTLRRTLRLEHKLGSQFTTGDHLHAVEWRLN